MRVHDDDDDGWRPPPQPQDERLCYHGRRRRSSSSSGSVREVNVYDLLSMELPVWNDLRMGIMTSAFFF